MLTWLFVVASFIAVWVSSRNTGLSTWWLGPESQPRFLLINLLPWGGWALRARPDFMLVVLLYWAAHEPRKIGLSCEHEP